MKKNILNLEGASLLTKQQQKNITGGLGELTGYDEGNPCQNYTEIVPTGCPCSSTLPCARVYGPGAIGNNPGPVTVPGTCTNGVCA